MTRTRQSAKRAGAKFERDIADHFKANGHPYADKMPRYGAKDRGDVANVEHPDGQPVALELKNTQRMELTAWWKEALEEADNLGTPYAAVVHKRHGEAAPGLQWVTLTVDMFNQILKGQTP